MASLNTRRVSQDAETIFIHNTTKEIDWKNRATYRTFPILNLLTMVLAGTVILVPLAGFQDPYVNDDGAVVNHWSYVIFQVVYAISGYFIIMYTTEIPLNGYLPRVYVWIIMPVVIIPAVVFILYYLVVIQGYGRDISYQSIIPGLGMIVSNIVVAFGYLGASFLHDYLQSNDPDSIQTGPKSILRLNPVGGGGGGGGGGEAPDEDNQCVENNNKPSLLPSFVIRASSSMAVSLLGKKKYILESHVKSCLIVLLGKLILVCTYFWCLTFTGMFTADGTSKAPELFLLFITVTSIACMILRYLGAMIDQVISSDCGVSSQIVLTMCGDIFSIIFQRNLFSFLNSWEEFTYVLVVTCAFEFLSYMITVSVWYEEFYQSILSHALSVREGSQTLYDHCCIIFAWLHGWQSVTVNSSKNLLHLSCRTVTRVIATTNYIVWAVFLRFGYNAPFYQYSAAEMSDSAFGQLIAFVIISSAIEVLVVVIVDYYLTKRTGISLVRRFFSFFGDVKRPEYVLLFIFATSQTIHDVFVAKIDYANAELW